MKRILIFGMGVLLCVPFNSRAAQTAQARIYCLSVRFHRATSPDGQFTLDLTTLNPSVGLNGELAPTFLDPPERGYYSRFYEYDTIFDEGFDGYIQFDVPMEADVRQLELVRDTVLLDDAIPAPDARRARRSRRNCRPR